MKQVRKLRAGLVQLTGTVRRYPLTILLFVLLAIVNGMEIQSGFTLYSKIVYTLSVGIFLSLVAQAVYERFFDSKDRQVIITSLQYLDPMGYSKDIDWLKAYADTGDFEKTFGFSQFDSANQNLGIYLRREPGPIPVTGYDSMLHTNLYFQGAGGEIGSFEKDGKTYRIVDQILPDGRHHIVLLGEENGELLSFDTESILSRAMSSGEEKEIMRLPDASFTQENDLARITFVTENIYIGNYTGSTGKEKQADIEAYILIKIK